MYADARLSAAMESMVRGIDAPRVPMASIRDRMAAPSKPSVRGRISFARYAIAAAVAVALCCAIFPRASLALVERFERIVVNSYAAADRMVYHLTGWTPPPPPPKSMEAAEKSERLSLAAAQAKVDFTIVPPAGVPSGAAFTRIDTMPVLVYDNEKHRWSKGSPALSFEYSRSDGRTFSLQAEKDDPRTGPIGAHIWRADDLPGGKVSMTKFQRFVWKNGDQLMTAIADEGISPAEVLAIRSAMHGQTIAHNAHETIVKQYLLP